MFHLKDGFSFERLSSGEVAIEFRRPAKGGDDFVANTVVDGSGWASAVAHVSARGETGETWRQALDFHEKARP